MLLQLVGMIWVTDRRMDEAEAEADHLEARELGDAEAPSAGH
jgi:hypothetical protein